MKRKSNTMNRFNAQTFVAVAAVAFGLATHSVFGEAAPGTAAGSALPTASLQNPGANSPNGIARPATADSKAQAAQFVQLGREALKNGNAQQATHWANQAKTLKVTFGPGEDSPEKLLMDIQSAAGLQAAPVAPAVGATAVNVSPADPKLVGRRNVLIIKARLALSTGDVASATKFANEAGAMGIPYSPNDDTHENVQKHIKNFTDTLRQRQTEGETENVKRLMAQSLIEQAQTLLGWGKLDEAASLATAAQQLNVQYNQYEVQPKDLLARVENARNLKAGRPAVQTAATSAPAPAPQENVQNAQLAQARTLTAQARLEMANGNASQAMILANQAAALNVPDSAFTQGEDRPSLVLNDLKMSGVANTDVTQVAGTSIGSGMPAAQNAGYSSNLDTTRNTLVAAQTPAPQNSIGYTLLQQAQAALTQGNRDQARQIVLQAEQYRAELDPASAQRLTEMQSMLNNTASALPAPVAPAPAAGVPQDSSILFGQLVTEFENTVQKSRTTRETDPKAALQSLKDFQKKVEEAQLAAAQKEMLLRNVKSKVVELEGYIADNRAQIELKSDNSKSSEALDRRQEYYAEREDRLKEMADEFNTLVRENRYAEAEVIGKRAAELYPNSDFAKQLGTMGKMLNRKHLNETINAKKEDEVVKAFLSVDEASVPQSEELTYAENWDEISKRREKYRKQETRYSEKELQIIKSLSTPVQANYTNQPLQSVMEDMARMAGVTIHLAPDGLAEQSVQPSQPVSLNTVESIPLKSALNLILEPLNLDYTVRNDVLMITSKSKKDTDVYAVTYPVADLVIPIPNFQPSSNMGLEGALRSAMSTANNNAPAWMGAMANAASQMEVVAARNTNSPEAAAVPAGGMGQISVPMGGSGAGSAVVGGGNAGFGSPAAGNSGGASQEDFDKLIGLITNTVSPDSWVDNGGAGTISAFNVNLSLVVNQTQEVHEQIANLLEQLRRLQDLQIAIECRFISLSDSFFERIGVDFNVNIKSKNTDVFTSTGGVSNSTVTGRNGPVGTGAFAPEAQDIAFRQGSSSLALPMYGDYDKSANAGATLGFAILSDVEAYLFMEAAQSTERTNVLQAPKVTLFNGQQALVQDVTDTPFVVSVIPVVGDFAAALQPVIVVLSEGTFMTVQAVASPDRRYVRLTVVPFFSQIGDVTEFTFTGSASTSRDTSGSGEEDDEEKTTSTSGSSSGTTVQLPEYSYVTVTTTVSVPDGGTILLGGIKRLSEGRNEKGVPILNKIPFINRLFKNTGIGRETTSLMMMVTPRIIIQEEEEELLGVPSKP